VKPTGDSKWRIAWGRSSLLGSILACVDENEACLDRPGLCWGSLGDTYKGLASVNALKAEPKLHTVLIWAALTASTIYITRGFRPGSEVLQISSQLLNNWSLKNGDWRQESEGFFQSSLALLQNEVVNVVNGVSHDLPDTHNILEDLHLDLDWSSLGQRVLGTSPGFKSVSVWGVASILLVSVLVFVISINPKEELVVLHNLTKKAIQLKDLVLLIIVRLNVLITVLYLSCLNRWKTPRGRHSTSHDVTGWRCIVSSTLNQNEERGTWSCGEGGRTRFAERRLSIRYTSPERRRVNL
jgi:hypothetical protein